MIIRIRMSLNTGLFMEDILSNAARRSNEIRENAAIKIGEKRRGDQGRRLNILVYNLRKSAKSADK
jgi:hypothetical protein